MTEICEITFQNRMKSSTTILESLLHYTYSLTFFVIFAHFHLQFACQPLLHSRKSTSDGENKYPCNASFHERNDILEQVKSDVLKEDNQNSFLQAAKVKCILENGLQLTNYSSTEGII